MDEIRVLSEMGILSRFGTKFGDDDPIMIYSKIKNNYAHQLSYHLFAIEQFPFFCDHEAKA